MKGAEDPLLGGVVTCDLRCPFSNSDVLFQSKLMCENLVWVGRVGRCSFSVGKGGGQKPPIRGVTCDL